MNQDSTPEATDERQAAARQNGRPATAGVNPAQLIGLLLEVVKSKCDCRPCVALRKIADHMTEAALGPDEGDST